MMRPTNLKKCLYIALIIILFVSSVSIATSQDKDRQVSKEKIEQLQNDSDFSYAVNYQVKDDPLSRIWNWLVSKFFEFIGRATQGGPYQVIALILIGLVIAYAIMKIFDIDPTFGLLYANKKNQFKQNSGTIIDDISGTDFEAVIKKAYASGDYREVVRFYYLFALNRLDAAEIIRWKKGKTNYEYLYEVENKTMRDDFSSLNYYFEYAVYGEFEVSEGLAKSSESLFLKINNAIK